MNEDLHREWSPEESRALESLRRDEAPEPSLEGRIVDELRKRGLLQGTQRNSGSRRWLAAAAIFLVGLLSGALLFRAGESRTGAGMVDLLPDPRFILLLYEDESYRSAPPGREMERASEYVGWIGQVAAEGRWASGAELSQSGTLLMPGEEAGAPASTPGTPGSEVGTLTGYFMFEALDLEQATEIASTCPHLRYGGSISVRALQG